MGYISQARGSYTFSQPLLDDELVALEKDMYNGEFSGSLGWYFKPTMHGLVVNNDSDEVRAYDLEDEVKVLAKRHPGHGIIQVEGEDQGDIWRLVIEGSRVKKEEIRLQWPDGTSYQDLWSI